MKKWTVEFNMKREDTCKKRWVINMKRDDNDALIIESIRIKGFVSEKGVETGCHGHPKTLMALVRNIPVTALDLDALSQATCMRKTSCGMNLATCVRTILDTASE